jgi:hypothetical protein
MWAFRISPRIEKNVSKTGAPLLNPVPDVDGECDVHIGFGTAVVRHAVLLTRHAWTHVANNVPCRDTTCDIHVKGTVFWNIASSSDSFKKTVKRCRKYSQQDCIKVCFTNSMTFSDNFPFNFYRNFVIFFIKIIKVRQK